MFLNATLDLKWVNFLQNSTQQLDMPGQPSSDFLRNSCFKCSNFPRIYCTPSLLEAQTRRKKVENCSRFADIASSSGFRKENVKNSIVLINRFSAVYIMVIMSNLF